MDDQDREDQAMSSSRRKAAVAALTIAAAALLGAGCGRDGPPRYDVSGTVQYQGKPVPEGRIVFTPDVTRGNNGPQGHAIIRQGRYSTAAEGRGAVGGPHEVRIVGYDGVPVEGAEYKMDQGSPLFPEYTTHVDLPEQSIEQNFEVPEKPAP